MEVLWAPWRMAYVGAEQAPGCIFCDLPARRDRRESLVLAVTADAVVMLNRFPYSNGHVLVAPRQHTARLQDLDAPAFAALMEVVRFSLTVLERELGPGGINIGMNLGRAAGAGIDSHLHWHLVPRWQGDTNFMPVLAEVKVISEHLRASYDRLAQAFTRLAGDRPGPAPRR